MKAVKGTALKIVQKYFPNVKEVRDSDKPLIVNVTRRDCEKASAKMPDECAVAKSLQKKHTGAIISMTTSYVIDEDKAVRYKTPMSVNKELVSFDRSKVFAPGEYILKAPSKHEKLGPRERPQYSKSRNKNTAKRVYHRTVGIRSIRGK